MMTEGAKVDSLDGGVHIAPCRLQCMLGPHTLRYHRVWQYCSIATVMNNDKSTEMAMGDRYGIPR